MSDLLAIHGGQPVTNSDAARFQWPRITKETEKVVLDQLHDTISIYDNSGIFGEFEEKFANYHDRSYGLLSNSGTSSILAMYESIGLRAGDEVLCPVYTFHATVSPMMNIGCVPVFCDTDTNGNISLNQIIKHRSPATKAVIVTHMWGMPVRDIEAIAKYCKDEELYLLEDCSHAHGARINNKKVGSFGDVAAWSLQGQKIITGGEGGILLTDNKDIFNRALLHGHYNKRPQRQIEKIDPMYDYYLTGFGLKLRAHPIAIAIANQQFSQLDDFLDTKAQYADIFTEVISSYDFLLPADTNDSIAPSWYAYCFQFRSENAFGITREQFVDALHAEGLCEFDIPGSTGLLNDLPLFTTPNDVLPRLYSEPLPHQAPFPSATKFYNTLIKLPVWSYEDEYSIVMSYAEGLRKVCDYIVERQSLD